MCNESFFSQDLYIKDIVEEENVEDIDVSTTTRSMHKILILEPCSCGKNIIYVD